MSRELTKLEVPKGLVSCTAFSPDGRLLALGGRDGKIWLWRVADGTPLRTWTGHKYEVSCAAFSPDSKFLATGSFDRTARLWRVANGNLIRTMEGHTHWVISIYPLL